MMIAGRRAQDQRSAKTRRLLLQATIGTLMDVRYANTSTAGIARRPGAPRNCAAIWRR